MKFLARKIRFTFSSTELDDIYCICVGLVSVLPDAASGGDTDITGK